eukprot:scaffold12470_cov150-Skeletonema_menzelii.AAC.1
MEMSPRTWYFYIVDDAQSKRVQRPLTSQTSETAVCSGSSYLFVRATQAQALVLNTSLMRTKLVIYLLEAVHMMRAKKVKYWKITLRIGVKYKALLLNVVERGSQMRKEDSKR